MKWILVVGAVLLVGGLLVVLVGLSLPERHRASVSRTVPGTPDETWGVMTDIPGLTEWRPGLKSVETLDDREGRPVWRETSSTGSMTLEVTAWEPPVRMVTRIADEGLPFGGTWTYELEDTEGGTRVTITEDGEIYNPFFRFMARFVFGYEGTARSYLDGLESRMRERASEGDAA